jgi:hypothetical protein
VRNKTGAAEKGENRQEGNQTLKAELSGSAKPATCGPSRPDVLKGDRAHERRRDALRRVGGKGSLCKTSCRRRNSERGPSCIPNRIQRCP